MYVKKIYLDCLVSITGLDNHSEIQGFLLDHPQTCKTRPPHENLCDLQLLCYLSVFNFSAINLLENK